MDALEKQLQKAKSKVDKKTTELTVAQTELNGVIDQANTEIASLEQAKVSTLESLKVKYDEDVKTTTESFNSQVGTKRSILAKFLTASPVSN